LRVALLLGIAISAFGAMRASAAEPADTKSDAGKSQFVLVPYPITDPAIGNGLLLGPVWMRAGPAAGSGPSKPQAFGAGALWTDGGSRGVVAFDHRAWAGGRWRTTVIGGRADIHFNYPGLDLNADSSRGFELGVQGASLSAQRSLGAGPNSLSLRVFTAQTSVSFDAVPPLPAQPDLGSANLRGLALGWARDTRSDIFAPAHGSAASAVLTTYPQALGASFNAQSLSLKWTGYRGLGKGVLGLRTKLDMSFGTPPFYLRPYVSFRGISALRYAGEQVASLEVEYRHPVSRLWDALAFAGVGSAHADYRGIESSKTVSAGGVGVRFRAAKLFGLTLGFDVAQGPDGQACYIQIGNAWTN
jgi:hypothetical protein